MFYNLLPVPGPYCRYLEEEEEEEPYLSKIMYVCIMCVHVRLLLISFCTPVPHLPLLFQGVSASGLPTKSLSLTPIKEPQ